MSESSKVVVPFGKYRGKPVEEMLLDRNYMQWLEAQPWFHERYGYLVVEYEREEPATPEHNKIQNMFLDKKFRLAFVRFVGFVNWPIENPIPFEFEYKPNQKLSIFIDVVLDRIMAIEIKPTIGDDYPNIIRKLKTNRERILYMNYSWCILVDKYIGVGASKEQLIEIFKMNNIKVVFLADVISAD